MFKFCALRLGSPRWTKKTRTVALNCKSAVSTSRSTIPPSNNHQHPRSSSLNTRKPKQKLMSKEEEKKHGMHKTEQTKREKNIEKNRTKATTCRNRRFKLFAVCWSILCVIPMLEITSRVRWHRYLFVGLAAPTQYLHRTLAIHATNVQTADPLIVAFVLFCSSRINAHNPEKHIKRISSDLIKVESGRLGRATRSNKEHYNQTE